MSDTAIAALRQIVEENGVGRRSLRGMIDLLVQAQLELADENRRLNDILGHVAAGGRVVNTDKGVFKAP